MMWFHGLAFVFSVFTIPGTLFGHGMQESILPPNDLHLQPTLQESKMTEIRFHRVIDEIVGLYDAAVWQQGGDLTVVKAWSSPVVNAFASQNGDKWKIVINGGLARRPEVTADGLALVVCHEYGHHLAGYPFLTSDLSAEANADYFATHTCLNELWQDRLEENAAAAIQADETVRVSCDAVHENASAKHLCYRKLQASQSLAALMDALFPGAPSSIETPSEEVADYTIISYPSNQCRLDTLVAGSHCQTGGFFAGIPWSETDLSRLSCYGIENSLGSRPNCWFVPRRM